MKKLLDYLYYKFEIISNYIGIFAWAYILIHKSAVIKEIELAHILQSDKVLHIGCGGIPYTALIISKEKNAKVIGIDNNPNAVKIAKEYLKNAKTFDNIEIKNGDGANYDVSHFDVIIIAYGVDEQEKILKNVLSSMNKQVRLILRKSTLEKNEHVTEIIKDISIFSKRLLLTQESVLIIKK